ncbi:efflux transporter outer membrane subunit [Povalibacter sp.]|uniref:efflux transporter outer membrane subunit n=1 Tax=Povalibacter sp. TaxID=1962978 RepID=UPI002F4170DB
MSLAGTARGALLTAAFALLGACKVGPDYRVPEQSLINAPAANGPFISHGDSALAADDVPAHWWRLYEDEALDALISEAFATNTDLRAAGAALARSEALLREARTLRQPSLPIEAGIERSQVSGEQFLLPIRPPVSNDYEISFSIGYDLDLFGAIRRGIEAAAADHEAVAAARDLVRINVAAGTARAYADVCGAGLELATLERSLQLQERSLALTRELRDAGRATDLDVTRSRQLVEQLRSNVPPLAGAQRNALYRLATLTGRAPSQIDAGLLNCRSPPRLLQALPVGDGAALLRRRPDVRRAERQLATATAGIGVATAQLYPDIQLGGSLGSLGRTADFNTPPTNFWNIGGLVRWQANQSAGRARVAAADASAQLALAGFDGVVLESLREAETALNTYLHDLQREGILRAARDDAAQAAADARQLLIGGRATEIVVIDAERTLVAAEQSLAQLQVAIASDQVAVFLALGGGWGDAR